MQKGSYLLLIGLILQVPAVMADCLSSLQQKDYSAAIADCFPQKPDEKGWDPFYSASFGSAYAPNEAAQLAKTLAEQDDANFQFLWSLVLRNHASKLSYASEEQLKLNNDLMEQARLWQQKAANAGQQQAMYMQILYVYNFALLHSSEDLPFDADKQAALGYLPKLNRSLFRLPPDLEQKVQQVQTKESQKAAAQDKMQRLELMSETELLELAEYEYRSAAYAAGDGKLVLSPQLKRVYLQLIKGFQNTDAAYRLARASESRDDTVQWMKWAAEHKHKAAMSWFGAYLICNQDKNKGMLYLQQAQKAGDEDASLLLGEMQDLGYTTNCDNGWIY